MDTLLHIFSHFSNCHGEWSLLVPALGWLPLVWRRRKRRHDDCDQEH